MKTILLTGGGTAGHVTPNIALLEELKNNDWNIKYIGSENGIEKELIEKEGIEYYGISSGKLRRYLSKENIIDIFKVLKGIVQAQKLVNKIKPDVVFSKGGFVSVPVVIGAKLNNVPIIIHESDITPGLANKIAIPFSKVVCTTFPETVNYIKGDKGKVTGTPIRKALFKGKKEKGLEICGFSNNKPIILIMGGSLGSVKINNALREALTELLKSFDIVHICGKGNIDNSLLTLNGYKQFDYISNELPHIMAMCDIVVSRSGSNSISEFLALKKPALLIPLSQKASRGDQILNANSFKKQGFANVLEEENLTTETLTKEILSLYSNKSMFIEAMEKNIKKDGVDAVLEEINKVSSNFVRNS